MTDTYNTNTELDTTETMDEMFDGGEFVFTERTDNNGKKEIVGGGYKIKSFFLQEGLSPMTTYNTSTQTGGKVSTPFEHLAVPAGLFFVSMRVPKKDLNEYNEPRYTQHETASDDMIDKLYALVNADKKQKRKTKKHKVPTYKSKTRKHK